MTTKLGISTPAARSDARLVSGPIATRASGLGSPDRTAQSGVVASGQRRVDQRADTCGPALVVTVDRADPDQVDPGVGSRAEQRNGIVGIVTDVGVDPDPHREDQAASARPSTARSAPSSVACANWYPSSVSAFGRTR